MNDSCYGLSVAPKVTENRAIWQGGGIETLYLKIDLIKIAYIF